MNKDTPEEFSPEVQTVLTRVVASVAGAEEASLLQFVGALKKLKKAWLRYRKSYALCSIIIDDIEFPEFTREQLLGSQDQEQEDSSQSGGDNQDRATAGRLDPSQDSGTSEDTARQRPSSQGNPGDTAPQRPPINQGNSGDTAPQRPPARHPLSDLIMTEQIGALEQENHLKQAQACTKQLQEVVAGYMGASAFTQVAEFPRLKSKHAQCAALRGLLIPLRNAKQWDQVDLFLLDQVEAEADGILSVAASILQVVPCSTPRTAGFGPAFPWSLSNISGTTTGGNTSVLQPPPIRTHPNVTQLNLLPQPTPTVAAATPGNSTDGGGVPPPQGLPPGPVNIPDKALYGDWLEKNALSKLPSFDGKITEYLEWREYVVPVLNMDIRGPLLTFLTLKGLLTGAPKEKIAHLRATDKDAVQEAIRTLDETYLDTKRLVSEIHKDFAKISPPDPNNPEAIRDFVSKVGTSKRAYKEAEKDPEKGMDLYDKVMDKLHLDLQRSWVKKVPEQDRNLDNLLT